MRLGWVALLLALVTASAALADAPPWRARRRPGLRPNFIATARVLPADWPTEPSAPTSVDAARFAVALRELCGWMPPDRPARYAGWILASAREFGEDPFLLGALAYRQTEGSCRPDAEGPHGGLGLMAIHRDMYAENLRQGVLRFRVREGGRWVERTRRVDRFPFAEPRLRRAEESIYFAAAILSGWRDQHQSVDAAFDQVPHRHHVSHFVWGDRVRSDRDEDRILTDRRRLLGYYGGLPARRPVRRVGVELGSPLDGGPRVVSSGLGQARDGGERSHRGIDFESLPGEPVRAVADGRVVFAGVDLPGGQNHVQVARGAYDQHPRASLGRGGRFVCILHRGTAGEHLRSCYMHLEEVAVDARQEVRRGELVGTVGRTGMQSSAAHLHFELHGADGLLDPLQIMRDIVIGDPTR